MLLNDKFWLGQVGHMYILPLTKPLNKGRYLLASCAHSGMELIADKLYTFENEKGIERNNLHTIAA
jgi:hypothetical protein